MTSIGRGRKARGLERRFIEEIAPLAEAIGGWSEVARELGTSRQLVSAWVTGRSGMSLATMEKLAAAVGRRVKVVVE